MRIGLFSVVDAYPNEDGRSTERHYAELLEQLELAEAVGLDSFWIAEHHFHEYGVVPRAAMWLAAASQRTQRIRLGAAVVVLPFDNPLRTAEDYAMVDTLSGGRLSLGVGSGYLQHEFAGFGINMSEKRERFDEALEIMLKAWSGQKFSFFGKFYKVQDVALNVVPVQKPRPPVAVAILNAAAARHVGARGFDLMLIPYATTDDISQLKETSDAFHAGIVEGQGNANERRIYFALHTCCGSDREQAKADAESSLERYVRTRLYARKRSFDELSQLNLIAVGDGNDVSRLLDKYEQCGMTDFLAITNFGGMPHARVLETIKTLGVLASSRNSAAVASL